MSDVAVSDPDGTTLTCRECGRKEKKGIEEPDVRVVTSRHTLCSRTVITGFCPSCRKITSWTHPLKRR